jgi:hypothetical protein
MIDGTMTDPAQSDLSDITEDMFLGGQLRLRQPRRGHRAGHDAILLAAATPVKAGQRIVEFGAGIGAAGLSVARRVAGIDLVLVEIDPALAALARANADANGLKAQVVSLDVTASADVFAASDLSPDSADVVLMNPPFNDAGRHRSSPDPARQRAHVAGADTLDWPKCWLCWTAASAASGFCRCILTVRRLRSVYWFAPSKAGGRRWCCIPALPFRTRVKRPARRLRRSSAGKSRCYNVNDRRMPKK